MSTTGWKRVAVNARGIDHTYGLREATEYNVVVAGAGPARLNASIRLKQFVLERGRETNVYALEKGSGPGTHVLSGAVMDLRAIDELFPDWKERGTPPDQSVTRDDVLSLPECRHRRILDTLVPHNFHSDGCYIISLGAVTKWPVEQVEKLGVEILPGLAVSEVLSNDNGSVKGVATGGMRLRGDDESSDHFQRGMGLYTKYTVFAEGARGCLGKQLIARFKLGEGKDPQSYAIGIRELWEIPVDKARPGLVVHTAGWPMSSDTYGGGFLYHLEGNKVTLGFAMSLGYKDPWLSPFEEMQHWKTRPVIRVHIEGDKRLGCGAHVITAGGLLGLPRTVFPDGVLVGCDAGSLNAVRIKGSHAAIKSGMLRVEAAFDVLVVGRSSDALGAYPWAFQQSWLHTGLHQSYNFK